MGEPMKRSRTLPRILHALDRPRGKPVTLKTLDDVARYILALPAGMQAHANWQRIAQQIIDGAPAQEVTDLAELSLFISGRLDLTAQHEAEESRRDR
jgi:hypothetical protein